MWQVFVGTASVKYACMYVYNRYIRIHRPQLTDHVVEQDFNIYYNLHI